MIKLIDEGLVIDEAQVAVMFLHKDEIKYRMQFIDTRRSQWFPITDFNAWARPIERIREGTMQILIPYPLVKAAYQPVEGEAIFAFCDEDEDGWSPRYGIGVRWAHYTCVLACPLTTGKTVGELRELVERCAPPQEEIDGD